MARETLRILWITERYPPLTGGMAISAKRQVRSLRKRGLPVDVLFISSQAGQRGVTWKRIERDGGRDILIAHGEAFGNACQRAYREILLLHAQAPYHLVLGFGACFPGYLSVTLAAFLGIPSLVSVRGNDFDRDWFEPKRAGFVREALARAARIGAVSSEKVAKIKALFPEKSVFWSPNGVEAALFDLLPAEEAECRRLRSELNGNGKRIIGIFGELKYKKQIPFFLAALRGQGLMDRVSLLITGRMNEECHALMADPALSPPSRHLSFRESGALPALYAACDFVAIPSLFEGFPNVLLEAMAAGAVPLVSDAGAMGEVIQEGKTGFLFPCLDRKACEAALARAMALCAADLDRMKGAVKHLVRETFSPEREADILEREIRETVKRHQEAHAYRHPA
jgi:glycosyltransferase involved in cell wall biosynthesis